MYEHYIIRLDDNWTHGLQKLNVSYKLPSCNVKAGIALQQRFLVVHDVGKLRAPNGLPSLVGKRSLGSIQSPALDLLVHSCI